MKEFQRYEIYRNGSELEMIAYMDADEFKAYASTHKLRRISFRTLEDNETGLVFEIFAYVVEELSRAPRTLAYWRNLRNHLQTLACQVDVYSKEYRNLCNRIKWIYDNRLTWRAEAATQAELPF